MRKRKRSRIRPVLKWAGVGACALIALTWLFSIGVEGGSIGSGQPTIQLMSGSLMIHRITDGPCTFVSSFPASEIGTSVPYFDTVNHQGTVAKFLIVRLRWLFWLALFPTLALFAAGKKIPPGHCQECGYNLTGNVSGICPECGSPIKTAAASASKQQPSHPREEPPP